MNESVRDVNVVIHLIPIDVFAGERPSGSTEQQNPCVEPSPVDTLTALRLYTRAKLGPLGQRLEAHFPMLNGMFLGELGRRASVVATLTARIPRHLADVDVVDLLRIEILLSVLEVNPFLDENVKQVRINVPIELELAQNFERF